MPIERETFEAAVHAHHKVVHRAARAVVRCEAEASDVVQQVFLRAFRGDVDLRGGAADVQRRLRWLAHRLALNSLRAARRRHRHELENALMAENPGPDSSADARDDAAAVRASIEDLDDVHRTTVLLRYQEDLTLAAIGELLGCAESTVHSRLQKAMELLRRRLCASGFAAAAVRLDELLPATATSPAVAPTELARNLLQIPACAVSSLTASAVSVVVAMLALVGVAVAMSGYSPDPLAAPSSSAAAAAPAATGASPGVERSEPRSETPRRAVREQDPIQAPARADAAPPPFPMLAPAVVSGTIASTNGDPIEGAIVGAICFALSSKGQTFEVTAATNAQGAYELSLPMPTPAGLSYRLTLRRADFAGEFAAKDLHLLPAEVRRGVDAAMRRWAADRPGPWTTSALVTDGAGRPVARASVQVFRRMLDAEGRERLVRECGETTDAGGRAALVGDHVGDKQVKVAAFGQPFSPLSTVLAIADAAPPALLLQLSPDVPLEVRVTDARTGAPLAGVPVTAERNDLTLAVGSSDVDGRMQLRGIDGGPVTLTGGGGAWSRFRCGDVRAGQGVVSLLCKAKVDPEDLGMHGSEIHGRVVDAATGMPIVVPQSDVGTWWFEPDANVTAESLLPELVSPSPFQTLLAHDPPPPSAEFHLELPRPGRYCLVLRTAGRAVAAAGPFDVAEGAIRSGVEIRVGTATAMHVVVQDVLGAPIAGAEVWIGAADPHQDSMRRDRAVQLLQSARAGTRAPVGRGLRTDAEGTVVFEYLPKVAGLCVHVADERGRDGRAEVEVLSVAGPFRCVVVLR